ncbi:hypothetical protein NDU88_007217 [Pleurodeles waltl]|uniref:Uncharacterized protein n=1 Tax=Pleurodeles waltl TaxID=8319 RepID=A0AAV7LSX8_PLEWA|nr:hypothetical protein NDU88_007217 [Pleurodeles waltl]
MPTVWLAGALAPDRTPAVCLKGAVDHGRWSQDGWHGTWHHPGSPLYNCKEPWHQAGLRTVWLGDALAPGRTPTIRLEGTLAPARTPAARLKGALERAKMPAV